MTLKKKILLGYGVICVLMGLVVLWAVINLISLGRASNSILKENYRSILAAENMVDALERQDSAVLLTLLGDKSKGLEQFQENEPVFLQWLGRAKDNITIPGEAELLQEIEADYSRYRTIFRQPETMWNIEKTVAEKNLYHQSIYPAFAKVRNGCIRLRNLNEETMYIASERAGQIAGRAIWSTAVVAGSSLLVALIFSLLLSEQITRPLLRFMEASRQISGGDYTVQVPIDAKNELGRLAREFNQMAAQLARYHEMNIGKVIAEKQKSETILTSIEDGLIVFDTGHRVTDINPAARRMLGLEFGKSLGEDCRSVLPEKSVCEQVQETAEKGAAPNINEDDRFFTIHIGDKPCHYFYDITAIPGKDGHLLGVVLLLRDVTRLKEVERLKNEFVMAASHELRTPLTSIGMSVDLLLERAAEKIEPRDRELLQAAHEEVQRLRSLVNDLLDLSKIEAGKIGLDFDKVSLHVLVDSVEALFKGQLVEKSVVLSADFPDTLPDVRADANKITWVLTNLVSNALRYIPTGGHIHIKAKRVGHYVHLAVRDDGPGIPVEYHTRIFQKFVQVKGRETGGTGLGLAICKEIVRAHAGTIWVESTVGKGSTFTFSLPIYA